MKDNRIALKREFLLLEFHVSLLWDNNYSYNSFMPYVSVSSVYFMKTLINFSGQLYFSNYDFYY